MRWISIILPICFVSSFVYVAQNYRTSLYSDINESLVNVFGAVYSLVLLAIAIINLLKVIDASSGDSPLRIIGKSDNGGLTLRRAPVVLQTVLTVVVAILSIVSIIDAFMPTNLYVDYDLISPLTVASVDADSLLWNIVMSLCMVGGVLMIIPAFRREHKISLAMSIAILAGFVMMLLAGVLPDDGFPNSCCVPSDYGVAMLFGVVPMSVFNAIYALLLAGVVVTSAALVSLSKSRKTKALTVGSKSRGYLK